jgi:hypothetical protein
MMQVQQLVVMTMRCDGMVIGIISYMLVRVLA